MLVFTASFISLPHHITINSFMNIPITLEKRMVCVTGLPRAGSTLLCQLLGMHPDIYSTGHSSPLLQTLNQLRHNLSDNEFLLAQLDVDFDLTYARLLNAMRGFMNGWFAETDKNIVVDKNRGWLNQLDTALLLDPNCRMLVCVRELGQIIGSIESQHQKTLLLDFPDHLANYSRFARADKLMADTGVVGGPLHSIAAMQDMPPAQQQRVYYVVFEQLMQDPQAMLQSIFAWLGLKPAAMNFQALPIKPHESDSHYRFKYLHRTHHCIEQPKPHLVPARVQAELLKNFGWFYETFYPGMVH